MAITIDRKNCDGCSISKQPPCVKSCPGDLIYKDFSIKKAVLRNAEDCWDCYCCVKVCPKEAIDIVLPYEITNRGASLKPRILDNNTIEWIVKDTLGNTTYYKQITKYIPLEQDEDDKQVNELGNGI